MSRRQLWSGMMVATSTVYRTTSGRSSQLTMENNMRFINGLEDAISNVRCAMHIGRDAIENALTGEPGREDSEAAAYALYNLEREIDLLAALLVTKPCRAAKGQSYAQREHRQPR